MKTRLLPRGRMFASFLFRVGRVLAILLLFDYWLVSVALGQAKQWDKVFGGPSRENLSTVQQTSDGGYILGGSSDSPVSGDKTDAPKGTWDYWVVKLDAAGNKEWDKTIGGNGHDALNSLQQTKDGGYILGGQSTSNKSGDKSENIRGGFDWDYWIVKLRADGTKEWDKTLGGFSVDELKSLQQTSDGGYILGGISWSDISGDKTDANKSCYESDCIPDYWVIKLDAAGNKEWDKSIGGNRNDNLTSLQQTQDGGYILGGYSDSPVSGNKTAANKGICGEYGCPYDYWVVKLDATGNKQWDKTFGGNVDELLFSLQQTHDGGYILGGYSSSPSSGDKTENNRDCYEWGCGYDYWVVKLDGAGNKEWDKTLGGSSYDYLTSLQQSSDGGYILGGSSASTKSGDKTEVNRGFYYDYWVVKLDADGTKQWDKTLGGNHDDYLISLQQTQEGNYILGGSSGSDLSGDKTEANRGFCNKDYCEAPDYWVVKLTDPNACNPAVTSFALVNADTHKVIRHINDGDVIDLNTLPTANIKISARTNPPMVGSVVFHLDGQQVAVENLKPYRYGGSNKFTVGMHTLTATPYCQAKGRGTAGQALTLHFQVIRSGTLAQLPSEKDHPVSSWQVLENNLLLKTGLTLAPNPVRSTLQIYTGAGQENEPATLSILSASGQLIKTLQIPAAQAAMQLDVASLASGVYTLKHISGNKIRYKRFVKL